MAGKAHGNGDRRGDNTICGLGDRLRRLTAGICLITQTIFPVMAAAPTHINPAHSDTAASLILPNVKTIPYTLGALESPPTVAARFGITVDELRRLNQFRTFARGFDNVRQGDEIDVPLINSNSPEARNLKAMQMERDGKDPQMQVAEMAQQSGTLLARDMDSEQAASMARGWVASSASAQATDWLSRWGTARVSLGVDEDFSLKSSSFEFLHPWYETPDNLVFSQHTLHRTDNRTQTNHGIGWRYFTSSWMSGVNMFIDHDLTRYHTRTGMGVEYWRDYLKLSGNGYLRLSNWRSAPELDNDYEARPANGWDLRAEGWLPAWPQLGGKVVYEQYYGDEVALFGKDERQNDPHAITAGLSYTPVPLISFSAEQRQGKQGENDTRIGMELTLQPGHSLQKQLDPAEVAARRSLVGSRYDLVDRNNNIVLEYRKKELVRLTLTDPLKGKPGEVKSLVSSLQTKYALKGYDIEAASLQSAGGKVAVSGKDIQVTIPPYRFTAMPETDNTYPIAVTAEDSKGNFSRREESMVVVEKPTLSLAGSTLSVDLQILLADGKSTSTLTYTARDSSGKPIPGMTLKTQVKGLQDFALSEWKDNGNGTYTQIVTAGKTSGALSLMPQFNGDDIAKTPALIAIVANTASRADSTIETDQDNYVAGKPIVVKVTLRDDNGNGVTGRKELLKQTVKVDNTKADAVSAWTEESEGIYKASYTAHLIGDKLTAQLTMPGWQTKHSDAFSIAGDKDTAKIAAMQITANNAVARRDHNTVAVTVRDVHQNLLQGQNVTFTVVNGAAVFADPNGGIVTTDKDGIASVNLASDQAVNSLIKAETNGSSQSVEVSFITGDISQLTSTIKTDDVSYTAGGKIKVSVTLMDEQKNLVKGMASLLAGSSVVEVSGTDKNETGNWSEESDGVYTSTRTAKIAGDRHYATLKLSTWSSAQQSDAYAIRESGAVLAYSSIVTDKTAYTAGGAIKVTVTLKDSYENLVGGQRDAINQAIQLPNTKAESIAWNEDQKGIYTATYTALLPGTGLKAQLQMSGWASALTSNDYSISGDAASAQIVAMQVTTGNPDVLANGSDRHTVNVRVEDQFGNVLPEQTVTFTVTKGAAVFANAGQSADIRTDAHGMAEVDLSSTVADASTVEAKINQSSDSKTVNFIADVSTAQVAELVVTQDGSVADGSTANMLRVRVTDVFGNVLAGQTVSVLADNGATVAPTVITEPDGTAQIADLVVTRDNSVADGAMANTLRVRVTDAFGNALNGQTVSVLADNGATVTPTVTTEPDGTVEISITSQTAGVSAVTATINSSTQSQNVTFIADVRTAKIADLVVIKDDSVADGAMANTLRARVTDAFGNTLGGQTVSVLADNGATVAPTVTTQPDGTVEISVTSQTAGTSTVTASINNSSLSQNVTFVADVRTAKIASLEVTRDNSVADGAMANTLRVKVTDAFGNALNGQTVSVMADNGATVAPTVITEPDGTVEISVTSQTAGVSAVTATINSSSQSQNVTFIADVSTAKIADLVVIKDGSEADGSTANTLRARVTDAFGNTLGGQTVSVLADNGATVAPTVTTQPDGTVEISVTSQTAGTSTVTASINNSSLSQNVTFVADVSTAKIADLVVIKDGSEADGSTANTLQVKVTDAFGNALAGQTVSVMAGNGATVAPTVITEPDGTVEISVTSQTAGTSTVTASINNSSQSRDVTFIADVRTAQIASLEVTQDNAVADGAMANTLRARVTDAFGNALAGQTVSVMAGNGATTAPTVTTQPDGTVEISVTSQTAGISTVTATINNSTLSQNVTFIADVRTAKIADLVVIKDGSEADGSTANTLRVKVTDAFGNTLAGQTVSVLGGNGATTAPTVITGPDGTVESSVTSQTAGISTVTATINNSSLSRNVTFIADVRTAQIASLEVTQDNAVADGAMANTLRVKVTDAFGNVLAGQMVSVTAGNSATVASTVTTHPDGTVEISVTSQTAGTSTVTASINSSSQSQSVKFIADVSTAQIAVLEVTQDNSVADGSTANTLLVRVTDAFGNTLAGQTVSVTAGNGATVAPTVITEPDGTVEISVTSQTAGISAVTASINSSSQSRNVTFIADVRTAQIADLAVIKDGSVADGSTANTLRARVTDAFGNALAGQTVSVLADNGATVSPTVITGPDGTVEISVTSQTAGISAVTVSINNSTLSQNVTFIADVRTAKIAELVVSQDNAVADGATANTLRVRVTDAFGNALAGQTVSVLAGNGATTAPTVTTQPDGTVEISVTSQMAGTSAVTASINSSSQSGDVTFIADASTAQIADLVVIKDGSEADGSTANTLRARVTDAFGNALAGQTVSVTADNGATLSPTVITGPDGTVEISVTSQTAGASTVTASINSSSQSRNVTFIADVRTAQIASLEVRQDNSVADGAMANTLRVKVTDAFGNALAGQTVSVMAGNGATVAPTVITEPDGTVEISVTSQTAGISTVTATINSSSQSRDVTFIADVRTAQIADLVVIKDGSEADGSTANTLRARVTDAFGNTLAGQTVSVLGGNGATTAPTVITGPDGTVEISVTSQTAGISVVTASINSSSQSRDVTFIADVRTAQIADLVVIKDGSVADGATANTLQVKVTDANGNALAGQTVSVMAGNGATTAPTVTTQPDGTVEISVTSQTAGTSVVTASINNSSQSQNVTFVPGDASQLTSTVETNKSNYTVGETITITVTLRDAFDNLVTGAASQLAANGVLTVAGTDPSETGSWVESGGVYTTTRMATIASTNQHANLQLQSWSDGVTSDRYDIQSGSPAQATSTIATDKNAYTAGETITVAVTLKDAHGNLVEGGESLLSGDNVIVEGAVRSGGWSENAGVYTATWSAQMAGDSHHATLKLSEWGSSKQSESYSIHSGAPVQANSAIRTDKSAYIAGEPLTVTVTLRDEFGNPAFGLTSEVIESYIDSFAVGGATPDSMQWVEQNNGEYTIVWTAWGAEENLVASLKLKTWAAEIKSSLYGIQPGAAAKTQSTIVADKTIYIAGDSITVTVVLKDAQGNFITDGVVQLNEENVQVRNADPIQGNNWVYNGNGQYQRQYMAHFAEANLNAQLKMAGWSDANYSNNYTIKPGEVSPLGSQLRIREVLVVEGADLPVSALLVDDFGNPVDNGLDLLDDAVYLQNVEKKEGEKWRYVGDGIYERTYMAYQEGENLTSFMEIKGWRIYGQPSYNILPFVEVESLSVNGVKFRATDGFPETGFDGAKFTLLLTHNMKNTDYNWTAGIYGINVDSNGEVTLSVLIRSEVTITGKPKNGKGNDVVFKFKIKKWFTSLGASSSNTWDIINTSCSYGQMPSSLELAQRPSGGVVPRKVGTLWGEYGNLKTYGNAFSSTDYWTSTQLMGVHEKFNPETGISELGTGKSSGLCVEYY
ncbi:Ig-like domain-containing protein [Escherichia coli]